jgi:hypothetical protein
MVPVASWSSAWSMRRAILLARSEPALDEVILEDLRGHGPLHRGYLD